MVFIGMQSYMCKTGYRLYTTVSQGCHQPKASNVGIKVLSGPPLTCAEQDLVLSTLQTSKFRRIPISRLQIFLAKATKSLRAHECKIKKLKDELFR